MPSLNSIQIQQALEKLGRGSLAHPAHPVPPAQAMRRAVGVGDYDKTGDWSWMFNPPPFNFLNARGVRPPAGFHAPPKTMGLGCGCGCGGGCGQRGMGLFDSLNPTTWGFAEWAIAAGGAFVLYHAVAGTSRARRTGRQRRLIQRAKWGTE